MYWRRSGRVSVNGQTLDDVAARAHPGHDRVALDDHPLVLRSVCRYIAFHKPYHVLCCLNDPLGRAAVSDYVSVADVFPAGRLDYASEGLLILSDDGWLLHRLTHPRYDHPKTYWV